jgi:hypothetical protein
VSDAASDDPAAVKDPDAAHPIAGAWRPMLREVVQRFVEGDYHLAQAIPGVEPVSAATAEQVRDYLADYGATLVELPDDTWRTSVAQWMETHWDILVDLWTSEEGRSDLVLEGGVVETMGGPRLTIHMVCVP